jgi:UDP-3-O-[3-hydroxymyristoyl] N-acetylglucosamine deacetylase
MIQQRTLRRTVSCAGIGLHSGRKVVLRLKPAPANHGIRFYRTDLGGTEVCASVGNLAGVQYATSIAKGRASIDTVEHLLAALSSLSIDNVSIELDHSEVPIMDGSAAPFVYLINEAGTKRLSASRRYAKFHRHLSLSWGNKRIDLYPSDRFRVSYSISFDHPLLRYQSRTIELSEEAFIEEIAPARTFGFLKEVEMLRQKGLALGGSLDNAVVVGETGILNSSLRFTDEFVRHKILDVIGDLALVGYPLLGHVVVHRGGHGLHTAFATKILAEQDALEIVESPAVGDVAAETVPASATPGLAR